MNVPPIVAVIGTSILFLVLIVASEIHEWWQRRKPSKRYSLSTRVVMYVGLYVLTVGALLFPAVKSSLLVVGAIAAGVLLVLCALLFVIFGFGVPSINRVFAEATELDAAGRTLDAITLLENNRHKAKRLSKLFDGILLCNLAVYHARLGDVARALQIIDEAIEISPNEAAPIYTKAQILRDAGKPEEGLQVLRDALPRFDKSVALQTEFAELHAKLGQTSDAATALARRLLADETVVDVLDRDEWRRLRLAPLEAKITAAIPSQSP